jgi:hypothetical protein
LTDRGGRSSRELALLDLRDRDPFGSATSCAAQQPKLGSFDQDPNGYGIRALNSFRAR